MFKSIDTIKRYLNASLDSYSYPLLMAALFEKFHDPGTLQRVTLNNDYGLPDPSSAVTEIPGIVFQTWKTHAQLPAHYEYWRSTFIEENPAFRVLLWDDVDNRNFIVKEYPWFIDYYDSYPREIFRADIVRYFFLYHYGGFYADIDSECLKPLKHMCNMGDVLVGKMGRDEKFPHSIPNAVMASKPGQALWLLVITLGIERLNEGGESDGILKAGPEHMTGPILLKDSVGYYNSHTPEQVAAKIADVAAKVSRKPQYGSITILNPEIWFPVNWNNALHQVLRQKIFKMRGVLDKTSARNVFPDAYIVTYWSHSW